MRIKALVRCSASLAVLAASAAPAFAQEQPQGETGATAQETPAEGAEGQPAGEEQIVVTGLRRSLQTSQNIKRESDQIVDVVVAEDIGRLPDRTVSEALARVPGVTVEREGAEAGDVFVRGLRDPATTYNGRDIFTAEARSVAPQDFPAGGVAALEVFKSLTAEQIEGNLAGLINVRSRRPFDFRGLEVAGSANMTHADLSDDIDFNGNLLVSNRWETGAGQFGILINGSYTALEYQDSARFVSGDFFGINPDPARPGTYIDNGGNNNASTVRVPVGVGLFQSPARRVRPSANVALQWRPMPELTLYVDGLYQGFRRERSDRLLFVPIFAGSGYTNVALRDGGRYAGALAVTGQARPDGYQAATYDETNTYQVAVGAVYDTDRFRLSFDAARTDSQYDLSVYGVDFAFTSAPGLNVVFDVPRGDGGVEFNFGGFDTTNLANYVYRGFYDRHLSAQGDDYQFRLDSEIKDLASWLPSIEFGVRYVTRDGAFSDGERYSPSPTSGPGARPYSTLPLTFALTRDGYRGDINPVRQLNLPTYDSIRGRVTELRTLAGFAQGRPQANPRVSYEANERSYTGYAQVNYAFEAGSVPIDGAIGLRAVRTEFELNGTSVDVQPGLPDKLVPLTIGNEYTDYLPNASIRARFTNQLQLRAAYTQTRTRPGFGQLNPGLIIDPPGGSPIRTARGGNPTLQPVESDNYDISLEYYFARNGFAAVALFRRDISGFIVNLSTPVEIPGFGTVNVFGPANSGQGRLQGVEGQFRTFFDFDFVPEWARSFGTELNFTYIDNQLDAPPSFGPNAGDIQVPDVSEDT